MTVQFFKPGYFFLDYALLENATYPHLAIGQMLCLPRLSFPPPGAGRTSSDSGLLAPTGQLWPFFSSCIHLPMLCPAGVPRHHLYTLAACQDLKPLAIPVWLVTRADKTLLRPFSNRGPRRRGVGICWNPLTLTYFNLACSTHNQPTVVLYYIHKYGSLH